MKPFVCQKHTGFCPSSRVPTNWADFTLYNWDSKKEAKDRTQSMSPTFEINFRHIFIPISPTLWQIGDRNTYAFDGCPLQIYPSHPLCTPRSICWTYFSTSWSQPPLSASILKPTFVRRVAAVECPLKCEILNLPSSILNWTRSPNSCSPWRIW